MILISKRYQQYW